MTDFPRSISFTITNRCNLKCRMCGQWSEEGYMHKRKHSLKEELTLPDWKRLVDECAEHNITSLLLRGGEPFLFPNIIDLIQYINSKGIFVSIDTNGTELSRHAEDLVRIGKVHITISVDGPEEIHDMVRGVKGCFKKIKNNLGLLHDIESKNKKEISKSICFTISRYSIEGLGIMPDIARELGIHTITIVPYYYVPKEIGLEYERELTTEFKCPAFSWHGFHHEESGIDFKVFRDQYNKFKTNLKEIYNFPYMPLTEEEYGLWFKDSTTPVGPVQCTNVEKLIDIQPQGNANFCVDFPDYTIGNVKESTICKIWNSKRAEAFREYRRKKPFAVCLRCGAKHMSKIEA